MANYKILVVDYEPRGLQQLREPLEKAGYEVLVAKDGLRAIQIFNESQPALTVLEAMLPKKHGFEVCQEIKKTAHGMTTPVVIVTSVYKGRRYRTQALHHYGCDEYLEKPVSAEVLLDTVRNLLEKFPGTGQAPPESGGQETELDDRLDDLIGGTRSARAEPKSARGPDARPGDPEARAAGNLVAFDPQRGRRSESQGELSLEGGPTRPPVRAVGGAAAQPVVITYPSPAPRVAGLPEPSPAPRPVVEPRPESAATDGSRQLAAGLVTALVVAALLLLVLWRLS
jgi:DNA-binding response OmpR family regulator